MDNLIVLTMHEEQQQQQNQQGRRAGNLNSSDRQPIIRFGCNEKGGNEQSLLLMYGKYSLVHH